LSALILASFAPAILAVATIEVLHRSPLAAHLQDSPNERSLHGASVARLGGIGIMAGAMPFAFAFSDGPLTAILVCAAALAMLSAMDDARSLPIEVRLPAHAIAALVALLSWSARSVNLPLPGWIESIVVVGAIVWMTNLFNFMDGADGLAGGMAAIGFAALALLAHDAHAMPLALSCAALASASLGFLVRNFPPARVFMGDAGSIPLGFLAGALGAYGAYLQAWPWWLPVVVFSPFIVDATVTLLRRLLRGERIWIAHRSHAYQRLVLAGWSHRRLAIAAYMLMAGAAIAAIAADRTDAMLRCGILWGWSILCTVLLLSIERRAGFTRK
jgi:UDP-N-acetylmuramyl pentapeptide phosphotransferase/UDP-N-acetylglucosamine-1-phosphate transferase